MNGALLSVHGFIGFMSGLEARFVVLIQVWWNDLLLKALLEVLKDAFQLCHGLGHLVISIFFY